MSNELILKKLEQMKVLLLELQELLNLPFTDFKKKFTNIRSAERNFQLVVELASDINTHIIAEEGKETPDTYRESFERIAALINLPEKSLPALIESTKLRNILVHEYDFDEDNFIFYISVKELLSVYEEYMNAIRSYLASKK